MAGKQNVSNEILRFTATAHAKKGKLDIRIDDWTDYTEIEIIKLIKWIQQACSEMDLQTKTAEEILNEYNKD